MPDKVADTTTNQRPQPTACRNEGVLEAELEKIYDSEINVCIQWLWDGGIEVKVGDDMNGFMAEGTVRAAADILPWLQQATRSHS